MAHYRRLIMGLVSTLAILMMLITPYYYCLFDINWSNREFYYSIYNIFLNIPENIQNYKSILALSSIHISSLLIVEFIVSILVGSSANSGLHVIIVTLVAFSLSVLALYLLAPMQEEWRSISQGLAVIAPENECLLIVESGRPLFGRFSIFVFGPAVVVWAASSFYMKRKRDHGRR